MGLPLSGLTIIEMAGLGPGPFAGMMLADHGASVIRVEKAGMIGVPGDPLLRNRRSIALDMKRADHRAVVRRLAATADGLVEGYRPGVMERLGLGPDTLCADNPHLVYGRVTGWGQDGPWAGEAGHDIDYLALSGLLSALGPPEGPRAPLNLVADFAGGGMMLAFAMVAALLDVARGGEGRVIDAAMAEGSALVGALIYGMRGAGLWRDARGANLLDGGSPFYGCYECADGGWLALGAIEPQFVAALAEGLGVGVEADHGAVAAAVKRRGRDEWVAALAGRDACAAPVLGLGEAPGHEQMVARGAFASVGGVVQPMPAPRYAGEAFAMPVAPREPGADGRAVLEELGYSAREIEELLA